MGCIEEIQGSDKEHWNKTEKSINGYNIIYLNEYVNVFMRENESYGVSTLFMFSETVKSKKNAEYKLYVVVA